MKALRDWVVDDGRLLTEGTERVILALADVMEAVGVEIEGSDCYDWEKGGCTVEDDSCPYCNLIKTHAAAEEVIKEVTHGTNT